MHSLSASGLQSSDESFSRLLESLSRTDYGAFTMEDLSFALSAVGRLGATFTGSKDVCVKLCQAIVQKSASNPGVFNLRIASRAVRGMVDVGYISTEFIALAEGISDADLAGMKGERREQEHARARLMVDLGLACKKMLVGDVLRIRLAKALSRMRG